MRAFKAAGLIMVIAIIYSCNKEGNAASTDNFSSIKDFFVRNGVVVQTYSINAVTGGSFTSPQGTIVTIRPNAFTTQTGGSVSGNVMIQFKDIYKKSDMLLSDMPTNSVWGSPLKSGGEFFIKALSGGSALILAGAKKIDIKQPADLTGGIDEANIQKPFIQQRDSLNGPAWGTALVDSVQYTADSYIFSLYQFNSPVDSGTWCNSDNMSYFQGFTQTTLTLQPSDSISKYEMKAFLLFKNIPSMVHVYDETSLGYNDFPYYYAPQSLQCTLVAIGDYNGKLYSSFVPITITPNLTVNFSLKQTTASEFISALTALN